jgi:hypothetical protein
MMQAIKSYYVKGLPSYDNFAEAVDIAKREDCLVEIRWLPNKWAGWYHEYVFSDSNPQELASKVPRVYGV